MVVPYDLLATLDVKMEATARPAQATKADIPGPRTRPMRFRGRLRDQELHSFQEVLMLASGLVSLAGMSWSCSLRASVESLRTAIG